MIHEPVSVVLQCSLNAWLKELASGDQRRLTRSGSSLEACSRRCVVQIHSLLYFTLLMKPPLTIVRTLRDGAILLFVCSCVRTSVACEIYEVIRYVAAPGGERNLSYRRRYTCLVRRPILSPLQIPRCPASTLKSQ